MHWPSHFKNRPPLDLEPFAQGRLSPRERQRVGYSIAQFQKGESSEARDYLDKAYRFAAEINEPDFYEAAVAFVAEENGHSDWLARLMAQMAIPSAVESWTDDVFRWVRSWGDIGWSSRVLLTAELLAQVYYPALRQATRSTMLQAICKRINEDEAYHIQFQTERISQVLTHRGRFYRALHAAAGLFLYFGTVIVVWFDHRPVLAHSLSFGRYLRACWERYRSAIQMIRHQTTGDRPQNAHGRGRETGAQQF